jgi:hypothetical protein
MIEYSTGNFNFFLKYRYRIHPLRYPGTCKVPVFIWPDLIWGFWNSADDYTVTVVTSVADFQTVGNSNELAKYR